MLRRVALFRFARKDLYARAAKLSDEQIDSILLKDAAPPIKQEEQLKHPDEVFVQKDINQLLDKITKQAQQSITPKAVQQPEIKRVLKEKYGLPIPNIGLETEVEQVQLPQTPTQRLFEVLNLNSHTSYQEYENAIAQFKEGLYGELRSHHEVRRDMRDIMKEQAIPYIQLADRNYMEEARQNRALNLSIPGSIETEHPHRFLKLRPVEEFRHTPLIPISDKMMREWNEKVQAYHRKGMYLEITKEQVYSFFFFGVIGYIMFSMLRWVLKKEEEQGLQFQRLKLRRMGMAHDVV